MAPKLEVLLTLKDGMSKGFSKARGSVKKFGDSLTNVQNIIGGVFAAKALQMIGQLVKTGVEFGRAKVAVEAYTGSAELAAEAIDVVQEAAGNSIGKLQAAHTATRFLAMGLADTAEEAGELTSMAVTLGATLGRTAEESIEQFSLMLANNSIPRMDTFGLSAAQARVRMKELGDEGIETDRSLQFLTAVLEQGAEKLEALDKAGFEATSSLDRLAVMLDDAKLSAAEFLSEGLMPIIDGIMGVGDAVTDQNQVLLESSDTYWDYLNAVDELRRGMGLLSIFVSASSEAEWEHAQNIRAAQSAIEGLGPLMDPWNVQLQEVGTSAGGAAEAIAGLAVGTSELTQAQIGAQAMNDLNAALDKGIIDQEEYDSAARAIMGSLLEMPQKAIDANFALRDLSAGFLEGDVPLQDYKKSLGDINAEIHNLKNKKVTIEVEVVYTGVGGIPETQHGGQFKIGGKPGIDQNIFAAKVSRGETVTVTPAGMTPGSGGGGGSGAVLQIGTVNVNTRQDEEGLLNLLKRI